MITFEEVGTILDDIADSLPDEFYKRLNGGIILLPEAKLHPESRNSADLYIMGEYHHDPRGLGRYISIYYGSFMRMYAHSDPQTQREQLQKVLLHEFTHHIESLAGERGLEIKDAISMEKYRKKFGS